MAPEQEGIEVEAPEAASEAAEETTALVEEQIDDEVDEQKAAYLNAADQCIEARTANLKKRIPRRTFIIVIGLIVGFGLSFMGLSDLVQSPNPIFTGTMLALVIMAFGIWLMDARATTFPENRAKSIVETSLIDNLEEAEQKRRQAYLWEPDDVRAAFVARDMALLYLKALARYQGPIVDCAEEGSAFQYGYIIDEAGRVQREFMRTEDGRVSFRALGDPGDATWSGVKLLHRTQLPTASWLNEQAKLWLHVAQGQFELLPTRKQTLQCLLLFEDCDLYLLGCGDQPSSHKRTSACKKRLDDMWLDATRTGDKLIIAEIEIVRDSLEGFVKTRHVKTMLGGCTYLMAEGVMALSKDDSPDEWNACNDVFSAL